MNSNRQPTNWNFPEDNSPEEFRLLTSKTSRIQDAEQIRRAFIDSQNRPDSNESDDRSI